MSKARKSRGTLAVRSRTSRARVPAEDPVVREVRNTRARLMKEAGGTIEGLVAMLRTRRTKRRRA